MRNDEPHHEEPSLAKTYAFMGSDLTLSTTGRSAGLIIAMSYPP